MKKIIFAFSLISLINVTAKVASAAPVAYTYANPGNYTWTCPANVTSVQVQCWGGGGGGGGVGAIDAEAGGGAGGSYITYTLNVSQGITYNLTVGASGASGQTTAGNVNGGAGGSSYFGNSVAGVSSDAVVLSVGGAGGNGTSTAGTSGNRTGGLTGGTASNVGNLPSSGASANFAGTSGGTSVGGASASATSGTGGAGAGPSGSAGGGAGGATAASGNTPGNPGSAPGGGGSGASSGGSVLNIGGAGGSGQVAIVVNTSSPFTPGSLAVLSPANAAANNTTVTILELATNVANQSYAIAIPVDGTDSNALRISGSAGSAPYLADSSDGTLLAFVGVNNTNTTTGINAITNRGVGTLNPSGNYVLQTEYTNANAPTVNSQPRCASTTDDVHWIIADQAGIYTNGSATASPVGMSFTTAKSFGGTTYIGGTNPVVTTFSGGTTNGMPGLPADVNATDFYMISSGQNGNMYDVLYYIDNTSATAGTINKYVWISGTWTSEGNYSTGNGGWSICAATNSDGTVNIYYTTGKGATTSNSVIEVIDTTTPANGPLAIATGPGSQTTLYTATASQTLKGIAFVPVAAAPTVTTVAATPIGTTTATLNGSAVYDGGTNLTDYGFYWSTTSPVMTSSTKAQVGTTDYSGSYTDGLTGLGVNTQYFYRAYANNAVGNTLGGSDVSFWTLANTPVAPMVGSPTTNTLNVTLGAGDGNPGGTAYAIQETSSGNYVQLNGMLGASPIFNTAWGTVTVTNLVPNTTYTFHTEAQNGAGTNTSFGSTTSGTTLAPPTPTISVSPSSLTFPPTLTGTTSGNVTYTVSGLNLTANITITAPPFFQVSSSSGSGFGSSVTLTQSGGTVPDTMIYVRFQPTSQIPYSDNVTNVSTGANNPKVAVTGIGATAPSVNTPAANPINTTSATLNGTVTATNGAPIVDRGFYWSASPGVNTTTGTKLSEGGTTPGAFSKSLTGLSVNTIYYFRAYATNTVGFTLDSADQIFYTLANTPVAPVVGSPTLSTLTIAIGSGDGNPASVGYAIYATNVNEYVQFDDTLGATAAFQTSSAWGTKTVTGLSLGTSYAFEVEATNIAGVVTAFGPVATGFTVNAPFTPGNVAVLSVDNGSANNSTFSIVEVNPFTATVAQTVPINGTTGTNAMRASGSAKSSPQLANSSDGTLLAFSGFMTNSGTGTGNKVLVRGVGTLNASNNFTLQTVYTSVSGDQIHNATTMDNSLWYIGDDAGIFTNGETTPSYSSGSVMSIKSFADVVYVLQTGSSKTNISTVSKKVKTIAGLPGLASDANSVDFSMIASGNNGTTVDTLYVLDYSSGGGGVINKFSLVGGAWVSSGSYNTSFGGYGLAAAQLGNYGANLYVTSGNGTTVNNALYQLVDSSGWNQSINISVVNLLFTQSGGATLKGVAFAPANPLTVTNLADSGAGTLRQCINTAWSGATIQFATNLSGGTISLASTLAINTNLTIDASALTNGVQINGQGSIPTFTEATGNNAVLNSLTITNSYGSIIYGTLTVNQSTWSGNAADGIDNYGTTTVNQSTFSRGTGGIAIANLGATLMVNQSTLSRNGWGIVDNPGATLTLMNSIVANNSSSDIVNSSGANETFTGTNIVQNLNDSGSTTGVALAADPKLSPLGNYGGPTPTMIPTNGSPAIGVCSTTFATDQRGFTRASTSATDIGAVGLSASPVVPSLGKATSPSSGTFQFGFVNIPDCSFTVLVSTNLTMPNLWTNIGTAVESPIGSGNYQFTDPNATNAAEFYQVTTP